MRAPRRTVGVQRARTVRDLRVLTPHGFASARSRARRARLARAASADDPGPMVLELRQLVEDLRSEQIPPEQATIIAHTCLPKCITLLLKYRHVASPARASRGACRPPTRASAATLPASGAHRQPRAVRSRWPPHACCLRRLAALRGCALLMQSPVPPLRPLASRARRAPRCPRPCARRRREMDAQTVDEVNETFDLLLAHAAEQIGLGRFEAVEAVSRVFTQSAPFFAPSHRVCAARRPPPCAGRSCRASLERARAGRGASGERRGPDGSRLRAGGGDVAPASPLPANFRAPPRPQRWPDRPPPHGRTLAALVCRAHSPASTLPAARASPHLSPAQDNASDGADGESHEDDESTEASQSGAAEQSEPEADADADVADAGAGADAVGAAGTVVAAGAADGSAVGGAAAGSDDDDDDEALAEAYAQPLNPSAPSAAAAGAHARAESATVTVRADAAARPRLPPRRLRRRPEPATLPLSSYPEPPPPLPPPTPLAPARSALPLAAVLL